MVAGSTRHALHAVIVAFRCHFSQLLLFALGRDVAARPSEHEFTSYLRGRKSPTEAILKSDASRDDEKVTRVIFIVV
jgi:hypothetical protein